MVMTAAVVVITSVAVERSGPFAGALIGALPTAAGAAYTILALEHPSAFIAASAIGSLAINGAVAVFAAVYALLAQRHGLTVSLGGAAIVWFAIAAALGLVAWTPLTAVAFNVAIYAVTIPVSWRFRGRRRRIHPNFSARSVRCCRSIARLRQRSSPGVWPCLFYSCANLFRSCAGLAI